METFFAFTHILVSVGLVVLLISWSIHMVMTTKETKYYGYGNFKTFKREFDQCIWKPHEDEFGLKDYHRDARFFASIIQFHGNGMVMGNPINWLRANTYARKHYKSITNDMSRKERNMINWKEDLE